MKRPVSLTRDNQILPQKKQNPLFLIQIERQRVFLSIEPIATHHCHSKNPDPEKQDLVKP